MKHILWVLALCSAVAHAQSANRISLEIGRATVWLGMEKSMAKQQIEASGMVFPDKPKENDFVIAVDLQTKRVYSLNFEKGRLTYADRDWLQTDSAGLPSIMNALTSLVEKGATNCAIRHDPMSSPETKLDRVFIDCGQRGILLTYGYAGGMSYNSVQESIGRAH